MYQVWLFFHIDLVDNETAMAVAIAAASVAATAKSDFVSSTKKSLSQYSVAALALLGELLAPMLDIIYSSEEKEKVILIRSIQINYWRQA